MGRDGFKERAGSGHELLRGKTKRLKLSVAELEPVNHNFNPLAKLDFA
jgi:hypothetical protein